MRTLTSKKLRKEAQVPSSGVYYAVPKNKEFSIWEIVYLRSDEINETYHEELWPYVLENLKQWFSLNEQLDKIKNSEYGLPRGRVQSPKEVMGTKEWLIFHGNDAPDSIKHQVLKAFGLHQLRNDGYLKWEQVEQEQMNQIDKETVWNLLKEKN